MNHFPAKPFIITTEYVSYKSALSILHVYYDTFHQQMIDDIISSMNCCKCTGNAETEKEIGEFVSSICMIDTVSDEV